MQSLRVAASCTRAGDRLGLADTLLGSVFSADAYGVNVKRKRGMPDVLEELSGSGGCHGGSGLPGGGWDPPLHPAGSPQLSPPCGGIAPPGPLCGAVLPAHVGPGALRLPLLSPLDPHGIEAKRRKQKPAYMDHFVTPQVAGQSRTRGRGAHGACPEPLASCAGHQSPPLCEDAALPSRSALLRGATRLGLCALAAEDAFSLLAPAEPMPMPMPEAFEYCLPQDYPPYGCPSLRDVLLPSCAVTDLPACLDPEFPPDMYGPPASSAAPFLVPREVPAGDTEGTASLVGSNMFPSQFKEACERAELELRLGDA